MLITNKRTRLSISVILSVMLIVSLLFAASDTNTVSAQTQNQAPGQVEQIQDVTVPVAKGADHDGYIVKVQDNKTEKLDEEGLEQYDSTWDDEYVVVDEPTDALDFIEPEYVEYIEPNYIRTLMAGTISPFSTPTINGMNYSAYYLINVNDAWNAGFSGTGAKVAVLDSGLAHRHVAFDQSKIIKRYNFVGKYPYKYTGTGKDNISASSGHGTLVTGIIASQPSNATGIAYNSNIYAGRIINGIQGNVGDFLIGLDTLRSVNPDVLNMSFGGQGYSRAEYNAIQALVKKGTIPIAAVGNDGNAGSPYNYPANYSNVIGVGSVNNNGGLSWFSNNNSSVMVSAPGNGIWGPSNKNTAGLISDRGTSFSSPIVAGAAALLRQESFKLKGADLTMAQFITLVADCSDDINLTGYDISSGYGILNIGKMTGAASKASANGTTIPSSYQISYKMDSGYLTTKTPKTTYKKGTTASLTRKAVRNGYNFSYWKDQNGRRMTSITRSTSGNKTLTPVWTPKTYKLKFNGNGGKVRAGSKKVKYTHAIGTLKAPKSRKGYNFLGWFTKKKSGTQYYKGKKYKKAKSIKLYAHWTKKKVVKFNGNGGTVSKYAKAISKGKKYGALPKPTRSGYKFKGWYTKKKGGSKVTTGTRVSSNKNYTLYARWKKK